MSVPSSRRKGSTYLSKYLEFKMATQAGFFLGKINGSLSRYSGQNRRAQLV